MKNINEGYYVLVSTESSNIKKFYYTSNGLFNINDKVIVETDFGEELGIICSQPTVESDIDSHGCFQPITRVCTKMI